MGDFKCSECGGNLVEEGVSEIYFCDNCKSEYLNRLNMSKQCKAKISFGDDEGDNECTFNCQLNKGHNCEHRESGLMDGEKYILTWGDDNND